MTNSLEYYVSKDKHSMQYLDESCGIYYPWFTKPFLDILKTWDLSKANIFEWGSGWSTLWFAKHCNSIISTEHNFDFWELVNLEIDKHDLKNVQYGIYPFKTEYVNHINEINKIYDYIIIDGAWRNDCGLAAISHLKPGSILILDNANQTSCGEDNTPIFNAFKEYEHFSYLHPWHNHKDWRTDYWIIK